MTLAEAQDWCRTYAASKLENFEVVSLFLPRNKRSEYLALYAFARGADDRADDPHQSLEDRLDALQKWRSFLTELYDGHSPTHPAFIALRPVIEKYSIERELFDRMITAFEQDQSTMRYSSWQEVLGYTRGSADPVGRWVLRLYGHSDPELDELSDKICTGLQLTNFIQDVSEDYRDRDRIYLPQQDLELFDVQEKDFGKPDTPERLRRLLAYESERAEHLLDQGKALIERVHPSFRRQLSLFHGGGRLALQAVRSAHYNVASEPVHVRPLHRIALLLRVLRGRTL
ncbi:squalene synthase HpnC [bacterium]|nr:squalene synthase HpnC [bacterium]